jgi:hypothetical protein
MSSAKDVLVKNEKKRQKKKEQQAAQYGEFADQNMKAIQKLLKERCPLDYQKIMDSIEGFCKQAIKSDPLKLELPPMNPAILSTLLYNMALWLGNTHAKEN